MPPTKNLVNIINPRYGADDAVSVALSGAIKQLSAPAKNNNAFKELETYRFRPLDYIVEKLQWRPWSGNPGQVELLDAYTLALQQQLERREYESGRLAFRDLRYWKPNTTIKNRLRIEAGHSIGKTKLASGIVNHFFDCFKPSIVYTFAPSWAQVHDLLWKEIKSDRIGKSLPGRVLDLALHGDRPDHFAIGRATDDSGGKGTERVQGQHGEYLLFILDEAEGIPEYVYKSLDSMMSGGISIAVLMANPRTRSSDFHKASSRADTQSFRISCINHPNVIEGREVVPNAVQRSYVDLMIDTTCEAVNEHSEDEYTFTVPWRNGIFKPNEEFLFRVLGIAPSYAASENTLFSIGRFTAAKERSIEDTVKDPTKARFGLDCARFGSDNGTLWVYYNGVIRRANVFDKQDTFTYVDRVRQQALRLPNEVTSLHIRIDAGGGFGSGIYDMLVRDDELKKRFRTYQVHEIDFGGTPRDIDAYANKITEMYAESAKLINGVRIEGYTGNLEEDLCERPYDWKIIRAGRTVRYLLDKERFRKEHGGRSPDDGDGFCLALGPDHIYGYSQGVYL